MTITVRNDNKTPLVIPSSIRRKAGFKTGEELEIKAHGGVITILPKLPTADDDYTPEQRRVIDARLAKALKGPSYRPFESAAVKLLKSEIRRRKAKRKQSN